VALTTGALGGFMLLATFNSEKLALINEGMRAKAVLIMLAAAVGCLIAGGVGFALARALV
jgi:fluoride ion exporter CrcB/FEX